MSKLKRTCLILAASVVWISFLGETVPRTLAASGDIYDLGTLGGASSYGFGVNASGQVTGNTFTASGATRAYLYTGTPGNGGAMADLGTLGGTYSYGYAINDSGQVTGHSGTGTADHAILYTGTPGNGGAMADLGAPGGFSSYGNGINSSGQVTGELDMDSGQRAFLYTGTPGSGGKMVDLGLLGGASSGNCVGIAINASGQVTGRSTIQIPGYTAVHAFLYTGTPGNGGAMADLGTLGGTDSNGHGINDAGEVVGRARRPAASTTTPSSTPARPAVVGLCTTSARSVGWKAKQQPSTTGATLWVTASWPAATRRTMRSSTSVRQAWTGT